MDYSVEELDLFKKNIIFSGSDEAGRGCLAGPVVGATIILSDNFSNNLINDSKKLNKKNREEAYNFLINSNLDYSYTMINNAIIDEINILQASVKSIHSSIEKLSKYPQICFIDGNYFKSDKFDFKTIIKGDSKYLSIAAASIIAKVLRDKWMTDIAANDYPEYHFDIHKGYATKFHYEMIEKHGICPIHRKSFLKKYYERKKVLKLF